MDSYRKTAISVGVLYIIGTVSGVMSLVLTSSILDASDTLSKISANKNQMIIGVLFVLIMGLALALVPVMMFPISKKYNEVLALGYVIFRGALETVTYIALALSWLLLVPLSQVYVQAGIPDPSIFSALGTLLLQGTEISSVTSIVFPLGALMFYYVLFRSKLIPRWISGWGLITAIPYLAAGLLVMFALISPMSTIDTVLRIPLGVQEMVMAVWLIVKGFSSSIIVSGSAK